MSQAICRLRGKTYGVSIRCSERRRFLVPAFFTTLVARFLLAFYALKHGIQLHGYAFMSNHYHLILTDPEASLGDFMRDLNSRLAQVLNARLRRSENLFSRDGYLAWELDTEDILPHLVYLALNPVTAGLVRDPADWPGLLSLPSHFEGPAQRVYQPATGFFGRRPSKAYPAFVDLTLTVPPCFNPATFVAQFQAVLDQALQATLQSKPLQVWPPLQSLPKLDPYAAPTEDPTTPSFQVRPHLARGASPERKAALKAWRQAYTHALYAWRHGVRDVVFPAGTFLMRRLHSACIAPET